MVANNARTAKPIERGLLVEQIISGWNAMAGQIDWAAIDWVVELLDVQDVELWMLGLMQVRDTMKENDNA